MTKHTAFNARNHVLIAMMIYNCAGYAIYSISRALRKEKQAR